MNRTVLEETSLYMDGKSTEVLGFFGGLFLFDLGFFSCYVLWFFFPWEYHLYGSFSLVHKPSTEIILLAAFKDSTGPCWIVLPKVALSTLVFCCSRTRQA